MSRFRIPRLPSALALVAFILFACAVAASSPGAMAKTKNIDVRHPQPVPLSEIYTAAAKDAGLKVLFTPDFEDRTLSLELEDLTFETFLKNITRIHGHFYTFLDDKTLLIANDTPPNRRKHEPQVIKTFYYHHKRGPDLMTLLRSTLSLKHIAVDQTAGSLVVRDSAERVAIAERLIELHDRRPGEVRLSFAVLNVDAGSLERLREEHPGQEGGLELTDAAAEELRRHHEVLAQPTLHLAEGQAGKVQLTDQLIQAPSAEGSNLELGMKLEAAGKIDPDRDALMVDLDLLFLDLIDDGCIKTPRIGERRLKTQLPMETGRTYLISGLVQTTADPGAGKRMTSSLSPCDGGGQAHELVLTVTPEILHRAVVPSVEDATLRIGNEGREALQDG